MIKDWIWLFSGLGAIVFGLFNAIWLGNIIFAILFSLIFLISFSRFFWKKWDIEPILAFFTGLATLSTFFSVYYYLFPFYNWILALLLAFLLIIGFIWSYEKNEGKKLNFSINWKKIGPSLGLMITWIFYISQFEIREAIRSPFEVLPNISWLILAMMVLSFVLLMGKKVKKAYLVIGLGASSILTTFPIIYKYGFGFDPFIHRATLNHIAEFGTITPKPLYYTGEYVIELIGHLVFGWDIFTLNIWLVPILFGGSIFFGLNSWRKNESDLKNNYFLLAGLFIPLADFFYTTPQALSYLFTWLSLVMVFLIDKNKHYKLLAYLFAITSLLMHPLAGIPAFFALAILDWPKYFGKGANAIRAFIFSLCAISLPIAFLLQAKMSGLDVNIGFFGESWPKLFSLERYFSPWIELMYSILNIWPLIILLLVIGGFVFSSKFEDFAKYKSLILLPLAIIVNYLILDYFVQFSFLIEYERQNYANRLIILAIITSLPFIGIALEKIWFWANEYKGIKIAVSSLLTILILANIYGAFPQNDGVVRSAGFNVAENDFQAVRAINDLHQEYNYVVLANQNVSAAALQEFGFVQYFNGDIFYYPIPTGGKLYEAFIEMSDDRPSLEIIEKVKEMTGVEIVYFVVNDYWWDSKRISELAKQITDDWFAIGNNEEIIIFRF